MVDAYATKLGGLTLAVNEDHFLIEDASSNSVLSLNPAISLQTNAKAQRFQKIAGFSTSATALEAHWQSIAGIEATSRFALDEGGEEGRFRLSVSFRNVGGSPVRLNSVHPLYIPAEGTGACAVGNEGLRALATAAEGNMPILSRLQGELLRRDFGAWFPPSGSPSLVIGLLGEMTGNGMIDFEGSRGKLLSLNVEKPLNEFSLEPGDTLPTYDLWLSIGNLDVRDVLEAWSDIRQQSALKSWAEQFDPSAEVAREEEIADLPEADLEAEVRKEFEAQRQIADEEKARAEAEAREQALLDEEGAGMDSESGAVQAVASGKERGRPHPVGAFRRALRVTEGVWPRWAAGRKYPPMTGPASRTRMHWRRGSQTENGQS